MGGLAPPSSCGSGDGTRYAPSRVALADIPGKYLRWIRQAGNRYGLDWSVIAGIYSIETDFGRLDAPGVRSGENSAGAGGRDSSSAAPGTATGSTATATASATATTPPTPSRAPRTCCGTTARRPTTSGPSSPT